MTDSAINGQGGWIIAFSDPEASAETGGIALVGGKGANLARLSQAGFPVPPGFLVSTQAYRDFVAWNQLEPAILAALPPGNTVDPADLEAASSTIRGLFSAGKMPDAMADALVKAYHQMHGGPVAVRSSATAEDLPDMSFAGQQDTYLNVLGSLHLLDAVVNCWSSLWTARAIGYRTRNHVPQMGAALAVAIQQMVNSQASGVLFTANPLTGLRSEMVIDATLGLGEALVSGRVEPDHYSIDAGEGRIVAKTLGAKAVSIHPQEGGGTTEVNEIRQGQQALPDDQILSLARMGQQVADHYQIPQDIEWAWADGKLFLLQSRAITSLYPTPEGVPVEPLRVFFSFAAVQGLLDPMTPLGRAMICEIFAAGSSLVGLHRTAETQTIIFQAGERLWANITTLLRNSVGRNFAIGALDFVEPTIKQAVMQVWDDPRLQPERQGIRLKAKLEIARLVIPMAWNVILNLISPNARRKMIIQHAENLLEMIRVRSATITGDPHQKLAQQANFSPQILQVHLPRTFLLFVSGVAAGMASFNLLRVLANNLPDGNEPLTGTTHTGGGHWPELVLEMVRGIPNNPTTEMDLALWDVSQAIRRDPAACQEFQAYPISALVQRYQSGQISASMRQIIDPFIAKYGGRGLGEIDMGRQRWFEDPTHVFEMISSYLQITDPKMAPDVVFARGAEAGQAAVDRLVVALRKTRNGWLKAIVARFTASRVRALMGIRESPKFFAVRMLGLARQELLKTGAELVQAGEINQADDLFYLTYRELRAFAANEPRDWKGVISQRREAYRRELLRRQVPRLLLSDGRAFYEGMRSLSKNDRQLSGSPVSPGSAEGRVRVVIDPRQAHLQPGEILVCPGTDPSWTPLFLSAAGLVMEVGGMMTHGAVVAREYGIPAVVGVDQATQELVTGQRIRIDGSTGIIELMED